MSDWNIELTRRLFLRAALAGTGIGLLGPLGCRTSGTVAIPSQARRMKRLVIVFLYGGNDGLNTLVPLAVNNYERRRGPLALDKAALHSLNDGPHATDRYALHASLPELARLWADGDVAFVQKVGYPDPNGSHFVSQEVWSYGVRGAFKPLNIPKSGWIARYADRFAATATGAISVGETVPNDMLGGDTSRFHVKSLDSFNLMPDYVQRHLGGGVAIDETDARHRMESVMEVMRAVDRAGLDRAVRDAMSSATDMLDFIREAIEGHRSDVAYPDTEPATSLRDIATLCRAGLDTRLYFTGYRDFDHHSTQAGNHAGLLAQLDGGLASFAQDMKAMDLWNDTVVAVVSEFGRRNYANGSSGTDHGEGNVALLLGGGIAGGLYGSEVTDADLEEESMPIEVDFRSIYREILGRHLDADPAAVFPEPQRMNTALGLFRA